MSWLHSAIRSEINLYYDKHGKYPANLSDLDIPFPGDNASPAMLSLISYQTDGQKFELSWRMPDNKEIKLQGERGKITTDGL